MGIEASITGSSRIVLGLRRGIDRQRLAGQQELRCTERQHCLGPGSSLLYNINLRAYLSTFQSCRRLPTSSKKSTLSPWLVLYSIVHYRVLCWQPCLPMQQYQPGSMLKVTHLARWILNKHWTRPTLYCNNVRQTSAFT